MSDTYSAILLSLKKEKEILQCTATRMRLEDITEVKSQEGKVSKVKLTETESGLVVGRTRGGGRKGKQGVPVQWG